MEMRESYKEEMKLKKRKQNTDNLQGFVFMAQVNNQDLTITENNHMVKCKAKDLWNTINVSVMDIEPENDSFKKCEYIDGIMIIEYNNRIIKIMLTK